MDLAKTTTITFSCDISKEHSGPTRVHSTGVPNYHIHPLQLEMLEDAFSNDKVRLESQGVLCTVPPGDIIEVLKNNGFSIISTNTSGGRKVWILSLEEGN